MSSLLVIHHNDADGRCSAAIAAVWGELQGHGRAAFRAIDYKDPVPLGEVSAETVVAIVDFSFPPEPMGKIVAKAKEVIWCDHHETAKDYEYDLPGVRNFTDKGDAGCECTWKFAFPDKAVPAAVRLLGDYDAWRLELGQETFEFYEGLKLWDWPPGEPEWLALLGLAEEDPDDACQRVIRAGKVAILYRDSYCDSICRAYGYETEIGGHRAFALNLFRFGSQGFGHRFGEYPVCIAYISDGERWTVSMYSETVDVGAIAKAYGGGGHKGAAGFVCGQLPFTRK